MREAVQIPPCPEAQSPPEQPKRPSLRHGLRRLVQAAHPREAHGCDGHVRVVRLLRLDRRGQRMIPVVVLALSDAAAATTTWSSRRRVLRVVVVIAVHRRVRIVLRRMRVAVHPSKGNDGWILESSCICGQSQGRVSISWLVKTHGNSDSAARTSEASRSLRQWRACGVC